MSDWLPPDFKGTRTFKEALGDLKTIAGAAGGLSYTHLRVYQFDLAAHNWQSSLPSPQFLASTGDLRYDGEPRLEENVEGPAHSFRIGEAGHFYVYESEFVTAVLETFDDADYYALLIQMRQLVIGLHDAYNEDPHRM